MPTYHGPPRPNIHYIDPNPSATLPVLLFHGLGATCQSWALQVPALAEAGFRPIAPDTPGFGLSTFSGRSMSLSEIASAMAGLLQYIHAPPPHVVGISMGGCLALQFALDYSHLVRKLVLVNTFSHLHPSSFSEWLYLGRRFILLHTLGLAHQAKIVTKQVFPAPDQESFRQALYEQILQADPRAYRAAMRTLARFNVTKRLKELCMPTLVITGALDTTVNPRVQRQLANEIPGAHQAIISGAGHAVIAEKSFEFNQILLDFLTKSDRIHHDITGQTSLDRSPSLP